MDGKTVKRIVAVLVVIFLVFSIVYFTFRVQADSSFEEIASTRQSIRSFTSEEVSSAHLLGVLSDVFSYAIAGKDASQIGSDYSITVFPVNATGSYQYVPLSNSVVMHNLSVNKETIRSHDEGWPSNASFVLVFVWNQTALSNQYFASAIAGCLVQNTYLSAVSRNLGTCCVGGVDSVGLRGDLGVSDSMVPLFVMPLGYPTTPYPSASPNYDFMTGNLPLVQYSNSSLKGALANLTLAQQWSASNLPETELSQLLWSAYGYTSVASGSTYHRTTPSSFGIYPLVIFVSNLTGVYQYTPENHSVSEIVHGDKRSEIANACANQSWVADSPTIFLMVYNSSYNGGNTGDGSATGSNVLHEFVEVDSGTVIQQLLLESSARGLNPNVVGDGLEDWNGTGAGKLRNALGLSSSLIPLYAVPVGYPYVIAEFPIPLIVVLLILIALTVVAVCFKCSRGRQNSLTS